MANLLQKTSNQIRRIYLSPTNLAMSSSNRNYKVTCGAIYISAEMRQLMVQEAHIYQSLFNKPGCRRSSQFNHWMIAGHRASIQCMNRPNKVTHRCRESHINQRRIFIQDRQIYVELVQGRSGPTRICLVVRDLQSPALKSTEYSYASSH